MSFLKDYFRLNRREYLGFRLVLGVIAVLILAQYFIIYLTPPQKADFSKLDKLAQALEKSKTDSSLRQPFGYARGDADNYTELEAPGQKTFLFPFDPNTATEEQLSSLGLSPKVISHLIHYRE